MNRRLSDAEKQPFVAGVMTFVSGMAATLGTPSCARAHTHTYTHSHTRARLSPVFLALPGGVVVVLIGRPSPRLLGCLLAFSSGVMLYISFADLMEHARKELGRVPDEDLMGLGKEDAEQLKRDTEGSAWLLSNLWVSPTCDPPPGRSITPLCADVCGHASVCGSGAFHSRA